MKRIAVITLLLSLAMPAYSKGIQYSRGSRCHDQVCWNMERSQWQQAAALADGRMAFRIEKMLQKWTSLGFPEGVDKNGLTFIQKHYNKIHQQFILEMRTAGIRWFFETQGYSHDNSIAKSDALVDIAEENIIHTEVSVWLYQAGQ